MEQDLRLSEVIVASVDETDCRGSSTYQLASGRRSRRCQGRRESQFGPPELIEAARREGSSSSTAPTWRRAKPGHQRVQQALSLHQGRVPARARQSAAAAREDRGRGRKAARRRDRSLRPLADARDREPVPDYAPPNAADYIPEARVSRKLWPRSTVVWAIAYNSELVKNPPKSWADLTSPISARSRSAT